MSIPLRIGRLQRYLNDQRGQHVRIGGTLSAETLSALEAVLGVDGFATEALDALPSEFDERTEKTLATLDPRAVPTMRALTQIAVEVGREHGVEVKAISGHRTWAEQDALYAQGRTRPGNRVSNARGGQSNHNFGIAVDFGVFKGRAYLDSTQPAVAARVHAAIAARAKQAGLNTEWGGDWKRFKDAPHHEIKTGLTMAQKRQLYLTKGSVLG